MQTSVLKTGNSMKWKQNTKHLAVSALERWYDTCHRRWAVWMERQWQRMDSQQKKTAFGVFVATSSFACMILMFSGGIFSRSTVRPDPVRGIPVMADDRIVPQNSAQPLQRLEAFEHYMDSLSSSTSGRKLRDSILAARPGLLDSIRHVKSLYNN